MSFAFETVAAKLVPFDLQELLLAQDDRFISTNAITSQYKNTPSPRTRNLDALGPIVASGGLVFPYNPTISEGVSINYDKMDLTHSNESYYSYTSTENVRISLAECTWTADTFENAIYTLSVIHFLRSYSLMDFGLNRSGRPPSPMWFSAYGHYMFHNVPVLLEKADWSFPKDKDYVGVPEFGSQDYQDQSLRFSNAPRADNYTWIPIQFDVGNISLIVQHSPKYWTNWNLDDFKSGKMLNRNGSFHSVNNIPNQGNNEKTSFDGVY